jgi:hypothetical protein
MMTNTTVPLTVECAVHVQKRTRGRKELRDGPITRPALPVGHVPLVARLMALALRFEGLIRSGQVKDYATLAKLGHVTRARVSQIMSLLNLAPDIVEAVLFLPPTTRGRASLILRDLLPIALHTDWRWQRRMWAGLVSGQARASPC